MKKLVLPLVAVALLAAFALAALEWYKDNRLPGFTGSASLYVYPETTSDEVLAFLDEKGVVADSRRLARVFKSKRVGEYLTPGYYFVNKDNSCVYVARMLNNGWESPVNLTLSGTIRSCGDIARKIGNQVLTDSASVHDCLADKAFLADLGYTPQNILSMFIPDTYQTYWTLSAKEIILRLKKATDSFWDEEKLKAASSVGLSRQEVSVLASIVTAESNYSPELPKIAGVYLNRLKMGMPLQADPTVAFCFDYKPERILNKHLEVDSPYNTYKYAGLPPGPICVPSKEALLAVLNPDYGGGNLYFCANPDFSGTHVFARTLSQHNANARAFQAELSRRHRAKRNSSL